MKLVKLKDTEDYFMLLYEGKTLSTCADKQGHLVAICNEDFTVERDYEEE